MTMCTGENPGMKFEALPVTFRAIVRNITEANMNDTFPNCRSTITYADATCDNQIF